MRQNTQSAAEADDNIADDEILYRRVPLNNPPTFYFSETDGGRRVESMVFTTRPEAEGEFVGRRFLSVERARLCVGGPGQTRGFCADGSPAPFGVISFSAGLVRAVPGVESVVADPEPGNPAHALVRYDAFSDLSTSAKEKAYRRLYRALADRVNAQGEEFWLLPPPADLPA